MIIIVCRANPRPGVRALRAHRRPKAARARESRLDGALPGDQTAFPPEPSNLCPEAP